MEFYFSQTLGRSLEDCGWKDIHETSFRLIKKPVGEKNAILAQTFELDCKTEKVLLDSNKEGYLRTGPTFMTLSCSDGLLPILTKEREEEHDLT